LIGIILAVVAILSLGTGVYLMIDGAVRDNYWILIVHIIVCLVGRIALLTSSLGK